MQNFHFITQWMFLISAVAAFHHVMNLILLNFEANESVFAW